MDAFATFSTLVTADRAPRDNYMTMISAVLPRPIAFVSSVSATGIRNLAPFSFFNAVGANPAAVMFVPAANRDGHEKDTLVNVRATKEFVVNVVPFSIRKEMNQASFAYPPDVDEFAAAGFTPIPSTHVKPPRVAESPVHMECRLMQIVPIGEGALSTNIVIGEVLCFHVASDYLLENGTVDVEKIDLVGRLGGGGYSTMRDRFDLPKPAPPT